MRSPDRSDKPSRGLGPLAIWILLGLTLAAFLAPALARGEVIYPHDNSAEAGRGAKTRAGLDWSYEDVVTLYIPETAAHLAGDHDAWLATWNPHNELGRPLFQAYSGSTFILARILSWWTRDAFVHYTWMAVLAVVLSAVFAHSFLLLRGLQPLAAWVGAVGISVGPLFPAWGMSPLVQWGYCWAFGCLWFFERWMRDSRHRDLAAMVFCVHAILLSGFPQHVLGLGWMVAGWMLLRILSSPTNQGRRWRRLGVLTLVPLVALISVLPSFLDLFLAWANSTRADNVLTLTGPLGGHSIWELFSATPRDGAGLGPESYSLGPIYSILALIGMTRLRKRWTWYWTLWVVPLVLGLKSLFFFRIFLALGLSFSAWSPIFLLHLPVAILASSGVDRILCARIPGQRNGRIPSRLLFSLARAFLIAVVVLYSTTGTPRQLLIWQPRDSIETDSKLAQELRAATSNGSRFAVVGRRPKALRWLPPNMEVVLGLRSLHSYYHMPSQAFHRWVQPLRPAQHDGSYDRRFLQVARPKALSEEVVALAGISTLVSFSPLPNSLVSESRRIGSVYVSALRNPGPLQALVPSALLSTQASGDLQLSTEAVRAHALDARENTGVHDRIELSFDPSSEERVLFLSQQYHPHWVARGGGRELVSVRLNDLFQGIVVPAHVSEVELRFLPNARWMWVPQTLFALGLAAVLLASMRRRSWRR